MRGLELSEKFYEEYGRGMIEGQFPEYAGVIAAGVAGEGSDCFGYDDEISGIMISRRDSAFWIPDALERELEFKLSRAYGSFLRNSLGSGGRSRAFGEETAAASCDWGFTAGSPGGPVSRKASWSGLGHRSTAWPAP